MDSISGQAENFSVPSTVERYRQRAPKLTDESSRGEKAAKILSVLQAFGPGDTKHLVCLDLGCGSGIIAAKLAPHFARVIACDIDQDGIAFAQHQFAQPGLTCLVASAERVPLADQSCDVIICSHVYEHVPSADCLVAEIHRLLKPRGVCFFSGPNSLRFHEPHLRLWFIHWLPRRVTNYLLMLVGRSPYTEQLRSWWGLCRLLSAFNIQDLNPLLVDRPEHFHVTSEPGMKLVGCLPSWLRRPLLRLFAPSFNLLLSKPIVHHPRQ